MLSQAIMAFRLIKKLHLTDYDCQLMTATASPSSTKKALKSNTIVVKIGSSLLTNNGKGLDRTAI